MGGENPKRIVTYKVYFLCIRSIISTNVGRFQSASFALLYGLVVPPVLYDTARSSVNRLPSWGRYFKGNL